MTRIEMLNKARQLAYEQIDSNSALPINRHTELSELPEDEAIELLAREFLQEAIDYNFGK